MRTKIKYVGGPLDGQTEEIENAPMTDIIRISAPAFFHRPVYKRDWSIADPTFNFAGYEPHPDMPH